MKMQNILKSERDGKIKSVKVKSGDSVSVDELLIEFEWVFILNVKINHYTNLHCSTPPRPRPRPN